MRALAARCPDIEIEAILVELLPAGEGEDLQQIVGQGEDIEALHGHVAVSPSIAHASPGVRLHRWSEAPIAEGRCGIGNTLEDLHTTLGRPAKATGLGLDNDFVAHGVSLEGVLDGRNLCVMKDSVL